jgi:hypothetical protein
MLSSNVLLKIKIILSHIQKGNKMATIIWLEKDIEYLIKQDESLLPATGDNKEDFE